MAFGTIMRFTVEGKSGPHSIELAPPTRESMAQFVAREHGGGMQQHSVIRYMGMGTGAILRRHIIPNIASLLIIDATLGVVSAIMAETSLSYFGFGVQKPDVSLGTLLADGTAAALTRPWLFVFPAMVLILLLFAISLIGDALRDAIDPTSGVNRA